jgi:cytochrome c oxidase subunit 4
MSDSSAHDVSSHIKLYMGVFVGLCIMTGVTVWVASVEFTVAMGIAVALVIATFKGSLVARYFMHLKGESKGVIWVLILTAFFFALLIGLPLFALLDHTGTPV